MSAEFWIKQADDFLHFIHPSERDVLHPIIVNKVNELSPGTYLDYGCGDGRMTAKINLGIPIDIYDISPIMIERAKQILQSRIRDVYVDRSLIPQNHYDVIVCSMVLLCIQDKYEHQQTLNTIASELKPKGKAIFSGTHPCFRQSFFSDFYTEYAEGKNFDYFNDGKPFQVTIHDEQNKEKVSFEDYHWSLAFTINSIVAAGLSITEIIETKDDEAIAGHNKFASPFIVIITEKK